MLDRIEKLKKAYPNALAVSPVGEMNPDASYELRGFLVQVDPQNIAVYDDRGDFLGDEKTEWQSMNRISGAFMRRRFQPIDLATFGKVNAMISNLSAKLNAQGVDVEKPIPVVPETESGV